MPNKENKILTEKIKQITNTQFCSNCYVHKKLDGGKWRLMANRKMRWKCQDCVVRTVNIFQ